MTEKIVVTHGHCHDGVTAAVIATHFSRDWRDSEVYEAEHGKGPDLDLLRNRDVLMLDFSWHRDDMIAVQQVCASLTVLDHHASAEKELAGLTALNNNTRIVFDMFRSGAGLAWDELVGGERHPLVSYVEDRDLWAFKLPHTREVHAACNCYPLDLKSRFELFMKPTEELIASGRMVLLYHEKLVQQVVDNALRETIAGHDVPSVSCPLIQLASDVGNVLARGEKFAAVWFDRPDGKRQFSLRSDDNGLDVSEIASMFSGGGHVRAAGFIIETPKLTLLGS